MINKNLDPIRADMPAGYTWKDLIQKAYSKGVDLCARHWILPDTGGSVAYDVYGAAVNEVILDVLTGETQILRTDILYDCGQPYVFMLKLKSKFLRVNITVC